MSEGLKNTDFENMHLAGRGKVRDMYHVGDDLLIVASDRVSAFDVVMDDPIPGKGEILTRMSKFWFEKMADLVPNHVISTDVDDFPEECIPYRDKLAGRSMLVKKANPLPVECVVRGYVAGSMWKDYCATGMVSGIKFPAGLKESEELAEPAFTPSTKAELGEHDVPISRKDMEGIVGVELTERIIEISIKVYRRAQEIADRGGIIIADTKMEFGIYEDELILIDELFTPDSSRFWPKEDYRPGHSQKSFDKQFLRDYLLSLEWDKKAPPPRLPVDIIEITKKRYEEALRRILQ